MTIAITMGDSSGVGPEIILHAFINGELPPDFVVVGDFSILDLCNRMLDYRAPLKRIAEVAEATPGKVNIIDLGWLAEDDLQIGRISRNQVRRHCSMWNTRRSWHSPARLPRRSHCRSTKRRLA